MEQFNGNLTPILNNFANGGDIIDEDLNISGEDDFVITGTTAGDFSANGGPIVGVEVAITAMNGNNSATPVYSTPQYSPTSPAADVE